MTIYRFYKLNADGHVTEPPALVSCRDDAMAEGLARVYCGWGFVVEVWCEGRRVSKVEPVPKAGQSGLLRSPGLRPPE